MAESLILRHEAELPPDVQALLHGPAPAAVWHQRSHPRIGNPFRVAAVASLAIFVLTLGLLLITAFESVRGGRFRSEGLFITLALTLFAAGFHWICHRATRKAERLEADVQSERVRFGLWLTPQHVLLHDYEGLSCARRADIAKTHVYHAGGGRPDLLVLTLRNRQTIYVSVNALDGWAGQAEKLREVFDARSVAKPRISAEEMQRIADGCLSRKNFSDFTRWLDEEAQRLESGPGERAALLAMADAALASWPDSARSPNNGDFMLVEANGVWEYGVNSDSGPETFYRGFKKQDAIWWLPLSRSIYFFEAESILPDLASVQDCAATLQPVPVTEIHFKGGMAPAVFDAFLAWVATKPLKVLDAQDYRPEPNSLSNLRDSLRKQLADFKDLHKLT